MASFTSEAGRGRGNLAGGSGGFIVGHTYSGSQYLGNGWWLRNGQRGHAASGKIWMGFQTPADALEKLVHPKSGPVSMGSVLLTSPDPLMQIGCWLGNEPPLLSDGYGGWSPVDRPRRAQQSVWTGRKLFKLVFGVILDFWSDPDRTKNVEPLVATLEQMCRKQPGHSEPPLIQIDGGGAIPRDVVNWPTAWWVLDDINVTEQLWNEYGRRSRYVATLTFYEYQQDVFTSVSAAQKSKTPKGKGAGKKVYVVKAGDKSLVTIAAKQLHDANRWHDIAKLNNIRDPKNIHVGERLKMP